MAAPKPSEQQVIGLMRSASARGELRLSIHAKERMRERQATALDVRCAIENATHAQEQPNGTWRLYGADLDGDELVVVVDVTSVQVVTVM